MLLCIYKSNLLRIVQEIRIALPLMTVAVVAVALPLRSRTVFARVDVALPLLSRTVFVSFV